MPSIASQFKPTSRQFLLAAGVVLLAAQLVYFWFGLITWLDEGNYLYGSTANVTHGIPLYSEGLPCWYTPVYYVALGWWQQIVGLGLIPARLFSVLCFAGALAFTVQAGRRMEEAKSIPGGVYLLLAAICPSVALYHASVTQFAFVNLQIAALIWLVIGETKRPMRWLGAGALTGLIVMTRPNYLPVIPLIMALDCWKRGWPGMRAVGFYVLAWLAVDGLIVAIYGPGAFWNLIRTFPGAESMASALQLTRDPSVGSLEGTDLGLKMQGWWATRPEMLQGVEEWFARDILWPYLPLIAANGFTLFRWRQRGYDRSWDGGMASLFFISLLFHFAATQTFCRTCARPYANYSVIFGLLGGAGSAWIAIQSVASLARLLRFGPVPGPARIAWMAAALIVLTIHQAFTVSPTGLYRKWVDFSTSRTVHTLASGIEKHVPEDAIILPLGIDIRLTEAIHLSGRLADPLLINFVFSQRDPVDPTAVIDEATQAKIRSRGLWTKELMRQWLREQHQYVIYREGGVIDVQCREILASRFSSRPLVPDAAPGSSLATYRLAIRHSPGLSQSDSTPSSLHR
jgi:hypothetical protein